MSLRAFFPQCIQARQDLLPELTTCLAPAVMGVAKDYLDNSRAFQEFLERIGSKPTNIPASLFFTAEYCQFLCETRDGIGSLDGAEPTVVISPPRKRLLTSGKDDLGKVGKVGGRNPTFAISPRRTRSQTSAAATQGLSNLIPRDLAFTPATPHDRARELGSQDSESLAARLSLSSPLHDPQDTALDEDDEDGSSVSPVKDEARVVFSLFNLIVALTAELPSALKKDSLSLEWVPDHLAFVISDKDRKIFEARTDGAMMRKVSKAPLVIVETKTAVLLRLVSDAPSAQIKAQEAAQQIAFIRSLDLLKSSGAREMQYK